MVKSYYAIEGYHSLLILKFAGEHKGEEFTKVNPFQKIPVIDHDGFVLTER